MTGLMTVVIAAMALCAAQEPPATLTLDQAIAEALRAEPGVRAARAELDAARGDRRQAGVRPNPDVQFEQREQAGGSDRQTTIGVELPLDLFRREPRIETAEGVVARTDAAVTDRERLLASAVRERYGDVLAASRRLQVIDAVVAAATRTHALLATRVAEGAAPPLDRDLALVELRRLEGARALAAGREGAALSGLKILLGRAPSTPLTLAESLEQPGGGPGVPEAAAGDRADVRAAAADLDVARAQKKLAAQGAKPSIALFGGYMRMDAGFPQNGISPSGMLEPVHGIFHNVTLGVKVSVPIFDRGQGTVVAAAAREAAAVATLDGRRLAVAGEVDAATVRLAAARASLVSYSAETRTLARRNLETVRETYTLGRATLLDVLIEQRRYLDFEAAYIDALAEAFAATTDLQRAKGALQ